MGTTLAIDDYLNELGRRVRGEVRADVYSRMFYSTDASLYQQMPHGVLIPQHADDVQAAVELAAQYKMPILARAGGTSLAGQCTNAALVIDHTKHLNQIIELNVEEKWVWVQAGMVLDHLNAALKPHGLKYGPDPASSSRAAVGGIVSNNSTGSHSIVYGMTADHVLEMQVFLSDGSTAHLKPKSTHDLLQYQTRNDFEAHVYRSFGALTFDKANRETIAKGTPRHWRRCGGYNLDRFVEGQGVNFQQPLDPRFNLSKLICGAEGTLAVISAVKLALVDIPKMAAVAVVHFDNIRTALETVPLMLETEPSAIELVDTIGLTRAREVQEYADLIASFTEGRPNCIHITEYYGTSRAELEDKITQLRDHLRKHGVNYTAITTAYDPKQIADVWKVRKVCLGFLMGIKGDRKPVPFIEDAAVPPEHLPNYIARLEQFANSIGTEIAYYAHASAGCLHVRPLIDTKIAADIDRMPQIVSFAAELLGEYGGALSSEHGDGKARSWANKLFFGEGLYGLYQETKQIFDPHNLLNPGNLVEAPDMRENLRFGADYRAIPIAETLDFNDDLGFTRAVEMCNGAGVCRKVDVGTMCPPFMVTREEEHSTRGRANALRAALTGRLPASELTSQRMHNVMELCVSCKACKSECPSAVDMAKIKAEWTEKYNAANGTPLRSRLFANIGPISKLSSPLAPLVNWTLRNGAVRWGLNRIIGISRERELPAFAPQSYWRWLKQRGAGHTNTAKRVVLLTDTYNTYNYPHITIAAHEVLEALGYQVIPSRQSCIGRPALSKGLLNRAKQFATTTLDELTPHAEQGLPIIGLEPSDVSAVIDDYRYLLPNDARVATVARQTQTFEQFVAGLASAEDLSPTFQSQQGKKALLHGHCHQKALIGTGPVHTILRDVLGYSVEEVDSGCCGMAGSFGYEAEHYDISLKMAQRKLLPAVAAQSAETVIVAAGVSCREQIEHGAKRQALHPAEVLHAACVLKK